MDKFCDVPEGICFGFKIGVKHAITSTFTPPNSPSGLENMSIIQDYYAKEENTGCVSIPYDHVFPEQSIGFFQTAPLGVYFRGLAAKPQIIQDHSYPRNHPVLSSINSQIDWSGFRCDWYLFHDCY